jgi:L-threonylcarbamoyladenylate synthase
VVKNLSPIDQAQHVLTTGGIIAYPTEAVWGLGCDPDNQQAVCRLLALKQRPMAKGLILVAAQLEQLKPYLSPLTEVELAQLKASWPGPYTWLIKASNTAPGWITGNHSTLAVRVSAHPTVRALCLAWGVPLVSTSANPAGQPPARDLLTLDNYFGNKLDYIVAGELGGQQQPTQIRDLASGKLIRSA